MHVVNIRLMSRVLFMPTDVTVLLPEENAPEGKKRKILWLLHGARGDSNTLLYSGNLEEIVSKTSAIIVMPSAINSDYGNYEQFGTGYDFPKFFFEELMPFIYSNFPASKNPSDNFLFGISMGGYGTASLGLAHPELFSCLGIIGAGLRRSAFLEDYKGLSTYEFRKIALADPKKFPTEYGSPDTGIKLKEVNVICRYEMVQDFLDSPECMWNRLPEVWKAGKLPEIYVACGTEDLFYKATLEFMELTKEIGAGEHIHFIIEEGVGHDGRFFDRILTELACRLI